MGIIEAAVLLFGAAASTAGDTFYVATNGSDAGDGSASAPFLTLGRAQGAARQARKPATVRLLAGEHYLDGPDAAPLVLDDAADGNVSWVGAGADATVLRGGVRVTGWAPCPAAPGVWRAPSPFRNRSAPFFTLLEGDAPATPARFPNRGGGWLYNWTADGSVGKAGFRWDRATGLPATFETAHARAWVWHPYGYSELTGLADASFANRTARLSPAPHFSLVKMFLEGAREFVDEAGEWALGEDGFVYLCPSAGPAADPNALVVTAVVQPRIFDIRGASSAAADVVAGVTIANLSVVGSGMARNFASCWESRINAQPGVDPTGQWASTREGMVRVENATDITVTGCRLVGAGMSAVWLEHHAQRVAVEHNWIEHVGAWGVMANGWDIGGGPHPIPGSYPFATAAEADVNFGHTVANNFIHNVGTAVTYGAAVYVHQAHSITVERNVLARSPRNLLSVFGVEWLYTSGGEGPYGTAAYVLACCLLAGLLLFFLFLSPPPSSFSSHGGAGSSTIRRSRPGRLMTI